MTSVTGVEVTPDLKFCKVYISVLGDDEAKAETMAGLKSAAGFIRRELARTVNLRNTPELNSLWTSLLNTVWNVKINRRS